ncbi:MAG: hypothetical protein V4628_03095 [Pseudomonadota bacterium]
MFVKTPKPIIRALVISTAAYLLASSLATAQDAAPAAPPVFVKPAPITQVVTIPGTANEGSITARYTVKADGTTGDVEIVGGFTNPIYEGLVKDTIAAWTFTPGTVNGEARDFLNQEHTFNIRVMEQLAISPAVAMALEAINAQLAAKDYSGARDAIQNVLDNEVHSVFDYALMNQMMTAALTGLEDPFAALVTIRKATNSSTDTAGAPQYMLTTEILQGALKQHLMMAAALRQQAEVQRTWTILDELYDIEATDELHQFVTAAEQQLASPDPLASLGKIVDGGWSHVPSRRIFTIADVREGTLSKVIAHCDRRTLELEYQADVDWNLPASVGDCKLDITGSDGTLFTVYEFAE